MSYSGESFTAECDRVSEPEWNDLLEGFRDASVYHTWAYGAVCWGEKQLSHLVLRRGGVPVSLAQLRIVRVPVIGAGIAYVRWGPVCTRERLSWDPSVWRAAIDALVQEYVVRRSLVLRILPNAFLQDPVSAATRGICGELGLAEEVSARPYHTIRVDLRPPVEAIRQQLSSRWRRQLNIAERNHLEIVEGHTDDLYERFLTLYGEMMARKQFETSVDVNDFRRIQQRLPRSQKMMTLICLAGGNPVAGLVVATVGDTAIYLLAATGDKGLEARGSYLLQWHAIQRLKELGREWYDLGGVNQRVNPGVFTFKSGMGGEAVRQVGTYQIGHSSLSRWSVLVGERAGRVLRRLSRRRIGRG